MRSLSITEACAVLHKSERQVRYLIKSGALAAQKVDGRWRIPASALPLTDERRAALVDAADRIVDAAEQAAEPIRKAAGQPDERRRFSVQNLRVFRVAVDIHQQIVATCGVDAPAAHKLHTCLDLLARGCHSYNTRSKAQHYCAAREAAASALVELLLAASGGGRVNSVNSNAARATADSADAASPGTERQRAAPASGPAAGLAERIEQELMGPFSGIIRSAEKRQRRGQFDRFGHAG